MLRHDVKTHTSMLSLRVTAKTIFMTLAQVYFTAYLIIVSTHLFLSQLKLYVFYTLVKVLSQLEYVVPYFEGMVSQIYPAELQLNKANTSDTEAPFLDLHLSILDGIVSSKIYDKRDDFDLDIVNFPFLDGDVPRTTSYGVYISQLIRFARVSSRLADFNARNKSFTARLLQQGYRYLINFGKLFLNFIVDTLNWFLNIIQG